MKKALVTIIIVFLSLHSFSQDYKADIQKQFLDYYRYIINKDFEKSADYINPDFFSIIPKNQMILLIKKVYNQTDIDFVTEEPKFISLSEKKIINNQTYVVLNYTSNLKMRFKEEEGDSTSAEDKALETSLMKLQLEKQFGNNTVSYDSTSGFYKILTTKKAIANSKDLTKWTFVVIESKQKPLLEKFLPKELLD